MFAAEPKAKRESGKNTAVAAPRGSAPALTPMSERLAFQLFTRTNGVEAAEREADAAASAVVGGSPGGATTGGAPPVVALTAPFGVILDDDVPLGPGQMARTRFVDAIGAEIERVANQELAAVGRTASECPYLAYWLRFYRGRPAPQIERAIQSYARPTRTDLDGLRAAVIDRVRAAVQAWIRSDGREVQSPEGVALSGRNDGVAPATATGGAIQRKAADGTDGRRPQASDPAVVRAQLRNGEHMEGGLRSRMERGFGHSFNAVRLHTDAHAAHLADSFSARAFTVGSDIAFGAGQYRPGTLAGEAVIAHELAHVVQQGGAVARSALEQPAVSLALESEADRGAARVLARASGPHQATVERISGLSAGQLLRHAEAHPAVTAGSAGLGLQRCSAAPEPTTEEKADQKENLPSELGPRAPDPQLSPTSVPKAGLEMLDLTSWQWDSKEGPDSWLLVWGRGDLYVLPARGLVSTPRPERRKPLQRGGPVIGAPGVGHGGCNLVRTSQGVGVLIDAGGSTLLPPALAYLQSRMGISQIDGAIPSHGHADHLNRVPDLVRTEQLTGNIYVWPGWEKATKGSLGSLWAKLREADFARFGKGPGWSPTPLIAQRIAAPGAGRGVTASSLSVGGATLEIVSLTEKLEKFQREVEAGRSGSKFADAAAKFIRVTAPGAAFRILMIQDPRGADLKELHRQMGEEKFAEFVRGASYVFGFQHHLGAVNEKADVEGIRLLLKAIGATEKPLTVVVQTDHKGKNADLVEALVECGLRVVVVGDSESGRTPAVRVTVGGELRAEGASVKDPGKLVVGANQRILEMTRAAEMLEKYPDLLRAVGRTAAELATGLRQECERLRQGIERRRELATSRLRAETRIANVDAELTSNARELTEPAGAEKELGDTVGKLARYVTRADEIRLETDRSRQRGEATRRLRELIAEVSPERAREILEEEQANVGLSKREQRRATRRAFYRMGAQRFTQRMLETGPPPVGRAGKGVAVFLVALEVLEYAAPLIGQYVEEAERKKREDFYRFLEIVVWWAGRGASLPVVAYRGQTRVDDVREQIAGVERRLWQDQPKESKKPEAELDETVRSAVALEAILVPSQKEWQRPAAVWDAFRFWVTNNVRNFHDYASEFEDVPNPAIRSRGREFQSRTWEIRTGRHEGDHVVDVWESSEELTKIMRVTATRVIEGTEKQIDAERARPQSRPTVQGPAIWPGGPLRSEDPAPTTSEDIIGGVTLTARSRHGRRIEVYGPYRLTPPAYPFSFWEDDPRFLVYGNQPAPPGYVVVGGANYNTHAAIRSAKILTYNPEETVKLRRAYTRPYEAIPREPDWTEEERRARAEIIRDRSCYIPYDKSHGIYRGEVRFHYWTPNVWAKFYVKGTELDPAAPSALSR